jgi:hypothetical protein
MNLALHSQATGAVEKKAWRRWATVVVAMMAAWTLQAQNGDTNDSTNPALEAAAMILSNAVAQISDFSITNEPGSNDLNQAASDGSDTNLLTPTQGEVHSGPPESRRQWLLRQRAGLPGTNDGSQLAAARANSNGSAERRPIKPEYSAFKMITERNVFDPNREPHRPGIQARPRTIDSFSLVGVMSYEKGTFAFFDGSSSDFRKALKETDTIAGFKLASIGNNAVKLVTGTNQVELRVGMQLRREEGGDWVPSSQAESYASSSSAPATAASGTAAGGSDNDVLERLRKKREQE